MVYFHGIKGTRTGGSRKEAYMGSNNKNNKNGKNNRNLRGVLTLLAWAVVLTEIGRAHV